MLSHIAYVLKEFTMWPTIFEISIRFFGLVTFLKYIIKDFFKLIIDIVYVIVYI